MSVPSDDAIREKLRDILEVVDFNTTTERQLRQQLEKHFDCSLKERKQVVKEVIESFLRDAAASHEPEEPDNAEEPANKRKRGVGGLQVLSPEMLEFMELGPDDEVTRNEVVKKLWTYIKGNNLQDPNNKRNILPDPVLSKLFDFPLNMFNMNKQLSRHCKGRNKVADAPKPKKAKKASAAKADGEPKKKTGFAAPLKLSDELSAIVGQPTASRGELSKLLWAYVKEKDLQNPENKRQILVKNDPALFGIMGVDIVEGFTMAKYIGNHLLGPAEQS